MLKQLAGRNQRTKGFKVKNSFQIFLFIAGCLWLLYQLKHSYDKKNEYEQNSRKTLEKLQFQHETPQLGRKGFRPWIKKPEDLMDDAEEIIMPAKIKVRRGGGSDEMNGHDQDKMEEEDSEEVEDLIDEEDKERMEEIEEEEGEDMVKNIDDINSLKDKSQEEGDKYGEEENENGASRVTTRKTQSTGAEFGGGLESSETNETIKQQNKIVAASEVLVPRTEYIPKVEDKVTVEHGSLQTVLAKGKDDVPDFSDSEAGSSSGSLRMQMAGPGSDHSLARILMEATGSLRGTSADENEKSNDRGIGEEVV